ncbi:hypothetical protein M3Y94_00985800 [Aphelenchoides besseyi]|nr:hypothetical protein M3Y94_00985800 [Aphelenchoides besseyi]KAI6221101.1 hypothetical protein M3Y95_01005400 [Aphelenchoides besseyi]
MRGLIVLLLLIGMLLEQSWAIKCYECPYVDSVYGHTDCNTPKVTVCDGRVEGCIKRTAVADGLKYVSKNCGVYDSYDGCVRGDFSSRCFCTGNLCNTSSRLAVAIGFFVVFFFVLV